MINDLATIIVPTYNSEKYILKMLNSIYNQSYRPIKLIIIDDNSIDNTKTIIQDWIGELEDKSIDVQFIRNKLNKGLTYNINYGVSLAQGKYILFADHDDIWENKKVESQIKFLEDNDTVVCCFTDRSLINERDVKFVNSEFNLLRFKKSIAGFNDLCNYNARFSSNTICFKNINDIKNIFPIDPQIIQHDFYVTLMLSEYGDIGYIHISFVKYRIHTNNLSGNYYNLITSNYKDFSKGRKYSYKLQKKVIKNDKLIIENIFYNKFKKRINLNYNSTYKNKIKKYIPNFIVYFLNKRKNKKLDINFR
ncbi:MAG: glycosyltransferase [Clostridium sp.]|uniref:glycosyltransferase n=1 Tax=Clostridium sp. TaxID=1506 RepID=UPI0039E805F5